MRLKIGLLLVGFAAAVLTVIFAHDLWGWILADTGTRINPSVGSQWYNFWSGFGANFGELALLGAVLGLFRHHNCHVKGCWRLGKPVDGTPYVACPKHHPDHAGTKRGISLKTLHLAHERRHQ